jgi:hypothetical protein
MYIEPVCGDDPALVRFVARAKAEMWGITAAEAAQLKPPPFEDYIGLFVDGNLAGFVEVFCYARTCDGYEKSPWGEAYDLGAFCGPDRMMHVEAIFVEHQHRRKSSYFVRLCQRAAELLADPADASLVGLYRKIGAQRLCSLSRLPWIEARGIELDLFVIDLEKVINGRLKRRFERSTRPVGPAVEAGVC